MSISDPHALCGTDLNAVFGQSYTKITSGTCSSNGLLPITALDECNAAAAQIGNADTSAVTTNSDESRPEGCYDNGNLWLATHASNIGNGVDGLRLPICRAGTLFLH
jgi:hypothetical protein